MMELYKDLAILTVRIIQMRNTVKMSRLACRSTLSNSISTYEICKTPSSFEAPVLFLHNRVQLKSTTIAMTAEAFDGFATLEQAVMVKVAQTFNQLLNLESFVSVIPAVHKSDSSKEPEGGLEAFTGRRTSLPTVSGTDSPWKGKVFRTEVPSRRDLGGKGGDRLEMAQDLHVHFLTSSLGYRIFPYKCLSTFTQ
ncbi:hypothetical protein WISP_142199 [Willisornis vidua]|uniref:Uncharacterized protein n=1 Tax=Willisornis vidua TaxID=1566151 RepID=A0ABQ9CRE5_9PASS|nr:hypothetical protein WISP_142199 [Willisornis vidua]